MPNVSRTGFRPVKHLTGAPYNGQCNIYEVAAGETIPVFIGDLVLLSDAAPTSFYPTCEAPVAAAATTGRYLGVVVGIYPSGVDPVSEKMTNGRSPQLDTPVYRAASTKQFVLVADSPDLVIEGQADELVSLANGVGNNFGVVEGNGSASLGSTTTGASGMQADGSSFATTNTLPLHCIGAVNRVDNENAATGNKFLFRFNTHALSVTTGATAV